MLDFGFDIASAISLGRRMYQEDAVAVDFPSGAGVGFAVVSDGMGGHAAGDVASKIVVTEVFSELKLRSGDVAAMERDLDSILRGAALSANACLRYHAETYPGTEGMGATLLAPVFVEDRLYWISIGDSPLYLFRDGEIQRLNQDHSLVPQIDYLVRSGLMGADEGRSHPDRNCLTSVLAGLPISHIDCRSQPFHLRCGDIVVAASDGLQFLQETALERVLRMRSEAPSAAINAQLMSEIDSLNDPDQDNVTLCIIKTVARADGAISPGSRRSDVVTELPQPRRSRRESVTVMASMSRSGSAFGRRVTTKGGPL